MAPVETGVECLIDLATVDAVRNDQLRKKTFNESTLSAMRWLAAQTGPGEYTLLDPVHEYPLAYCHSSFAFTFLMQQLSRSGLVDIDPALPFLGVRLAGASGRWVESQLAEGQRTAGVYCHVLLACDESVEKTIRAGVSAAGYRAMLVKDAEFTDGILRQKLRRKKKKPVCGGRLYGEKGGVYLARTPRNLRRR